MMDFIMIPVVVGTITLGIYKLFELFVRRKERLMMIEKMQSVFEDELKPIKFQFPEKANSSFGSLKIACLLLGIGLGLLVGFFILNGQGRAYINSDEWYARQTSSIIYGASVMLFGGLGLLVAFLVEQRISKKDKL